MKLKCIIIEDQPPAQRILTKFITDIGSLELTGTFSDALRAMEFLQSQSVDLIFLDLHLPKISGIDFIKMMQNPPHVILTTAFPDYALESYELNVVDYLLKPFSFQRFVKAVAKVPRPPVAAANPEFAGPPTLEEEEVFIKSGYDLIKISVNDIHYIKSDKDYTELFLPGKKLLSSEPLRHWEDTLDARQFIRIHKSYIINISKIEKISGNLVCLPESIELPIGRAFKDRFFERINLKG